MIYWPFCPPTHLLNQPSLGLLDGFSVGIAQGLPGSQDREVVHSQWSCLLSHLTGPPSSACSLVCLVSTMQSWVRGPSRSLRPTGRAAWPGLGVVSSTTTFSRAHPSIGNICWAGVPFLASLTLWYFFFLVAWDDIVYSSSSKHCFSGDTLAPVAFYLLS